MPSASWQPQRIAQPGPPWRRCWVSAVPRAILPSRGSPACWIQGSWLMPAGTRRPGCWRPRLGTGSSGGTAASSIPGPVRPAQPGGRRRRWCWAATSARYLRACGHGRCATSARKPGARCTRPGGRRLARPAWHLMSAGGTRLPSRSRSPVRSTFAGSPRWPWPSCSTGCSSGSRLRSRATAGSCAAWLRNCVRRRCLRWRGCPPRTSRRGGRWSIRWWPTSGGRSLTRAPRSPRTGGT